MCSFKYFQNEAESVASSRLMCAFWISGRASASCDKWSKGPFDKWKDTYEWPGLKALLAAPIKSLRSAHPIIAPAVTMATATDTVAPPPGVAS